MNVLIKEIKNLPKEVEDIILDYQKEMYIIPYCEEYWKAIGRLKYVRNHPCWYTHQRKHYYKKRRNTIFIQIRDIMKRLRYFDNKTVMEQRLIMKAKLLAVLSELGSFSSPKRKHFYTSQILVHYGSDS